MRNILYLQTLRQTQIFGVTDSVGGICVDPGEKGAIVEAGGPDPPGGGKGGQLSSDSGGG
jgi:hypothetical protein